MFPKRRLLYHRGVDDHVGTYVTDYAYSAACLVLCAQLLVRMRRERQKISTSRERRVTSSCERVTNWLPWNWPKAKPTPVAMSTVGVVLVGFANFMMALFGGITHQFVQTVEPYKDSDDLWSWLVVWRWAASFSACLCLGVVILAEQLLVQERVVHLPPLLRIGYYVTTIPACVALFGYNFVPLTGKTEDPFSVKLSFMISFGVMLLYGIVTVAVAVRYIVCRSGHPVIQLDQEISYSYAPSQDNKRTERRPYQKAFYFCCKNVVVQCHGNAGDVTSRKWELILTVMSPWIYVGAGVLNYFLKSKCADSDHAFVELGCPLPDAFNHNAAMHVIQIFSLICFFLAENISMTRRRNISSAEYRRIVTTSTVYNDVTVNSATASAETYLYSVNNNRSSAREDLLCKIVAGKYVEIVDDVTTVDGDVTKNLRFPTNFSCENECADNRLSVYDNVSTSLVANDSNPT